MIDDTTNDKYKLMIKVNNNMTHCQVDLGSQVTLVREQDAHKLELKWESVDSPLLRGLGNIPYLPKGRAFVSIEVQGVREDNVEILVVDSCLINVPVLLGHTFTERPSLKIVKTPNSLQFERVDVENDVKIALRTVDDVEVGVGKMSPIEVGSHSAYSGKIYVGGSVRGLPGNEYYLLPGEYQCGNRQVSGPHTECG